MKIEQCFNPRLAVLAASVVFAACATVPRDRGASATSELLKERSPRAAEISLQGVDSQATVARLLAQPIDVDDAVLLALLRNPRMRELYGDLGVAQAELYDATRLTNPSVGYSRLSSSSEVKTTWSVSQNVTELLFVRYRTRLGRGQLLQTQQRVANDILLLEADVRARYFRYTGANLLAQMYAQTHAAASVSSHYAQALYDAGNIGALQLSREQAAASSAEIAKRRADGEALMARAELLTALGLTDDARVQFVERLELPAAATVDVHSLQAWAATHRLDLAATREAEKILRDSAKHARRWRWFGGVSVGVERESDGETLTGPTASIEAPLFNFGGGKALRAASDWEQVAARSAALELSIVNDVVARHAQLEAARLNAETYRDKLVPLQERIVELTQEHYNYMLVGAFELLSAKQVAIDTYRDYLNAVRDYWLARVALMRAVGGHLPGTTIGGARPTGERP